MSCRVLGCPLVHLDYDDFQFFCRTNAVIESNCFADALAKGGVDGSNIFMFLLLCLCWLDVIALLVAMWAAVPAYGRANNNVMKLKGCCNSCNVVVMKTLVGQKLKAVNKADVYGVFPGEDGGLNFCILEKWQAQLNLIANMH
ncbi:hypothetical protein J1N35_031725 [Gossypium stocksii]|uniref:Uncharacterized protein n=1 Tax=Gossypium stocksii TaxID=47602 RepID=A0A9D3V1Y2_9ROSI|nr:hypothetical protein J1N35_031725 [Gossypium stocksii]